MENFFTPKRIWTAAAPFPHVLVLLSEFEEFRAYARAHTELLEKYQEVLGVIPEQWLHSAVQGIHHAVDAAQMARLRSAFRQEMAGMRSFQVQLGPVWPGVTAVTVAVYPEDGMAALNRRVRAAAAAVPGICLRPPEQRFWAHASLAYARADFPDRDLNRRCGHCGPRASPSPSTASTSSTSASTPTRATTRGRSSKNSCQRSSNFDPGSLSEN